MFKQLLRRIFLTSVIIMTLIACVPAVHASGNLKTESPTKEEIVEMWKKVTSTKNIFVEMPSIKAPYATGKLTDEFLETGLTMTNYIRFVANLPLVELDDTLNVDAQHGAVVLAAIDQLTHHPEQPEDMDNAFYNRAEQATRTSNIACAYGYSDNDMIKLALQLFMDDGDISNNDQVGHRRWVLNPTLKYIGFGYAESESGWGYVDMKVFDASGF